MPVSNTKQVTATRPPPGDGDTPANFQAREWLEK
jgi:hypothetical protein